MRLEKYLKEDVSMSDVKAFEKKWLSKLKPMGLTAFEFSTHVGKLRLNRKENIPPITPEELDFVMNAFVSKMGATLRKDIQDVANNTAKRKGFDKQNIPPNNIEYTIKSNSTKINMALALHQDKKAGGSMDNTTAKQMKGTAVLVPITILRKKGFKTNRGVEVIVERKEIHDESLYEMSDTWKLANKKFSLVYDAKKKKYELILQGSGKVQRSWVIDDKKHTAWKVKIAHELYDKGYAEV